MATMDSKYIQHLRKIGAVLLRLISRTLKLPASTETFSGQFKLRLPKSLHRDLTERAKEEGTSLNQYCVYLLSQRIRTHSI